MKYAIYGLSLLWATTLAPLRCQAAELTGTIQVPDELLHVLIDTGCDHWRCCTPGTDAERLQQLAAHFGGTVEVRP